MTEVLVVAVLVAQTGSSESLKARFLREYPAANDRIRDVYSRLKIECTRTVHRETFGAGPETGFQDHWSYLARDQWVRVDRHRVTFPQLRRDDPGPSSVRIGDGFASAWGPQGAFRVTLKTEGNVLVRPPRAVEGRTIEGVDPWMNHEFEAAYLPYALLNTRISEFVRLPSVSIVDVLERSLASSRKGVELRWTLKEEGGFAREGHWVFDPGRSWVVVAFSERISSKPVRINGEIEYGSEHEGVPLLAEVRAFYERINPPKVESRYTWKIEEISVANAQADDFTPAAYGLPYASPDQRPFGGPYLLIGGTIGLLVCAFIAWRLARHRAGTANG